GRRARRRRAGPPAVDRRFGGLADREGDDLDGDPALLIPVAQADALDADRLAAAPGLVDRVAKLERQTDARHLEDVEARLAGRRIEVRAGAAAELHDGKV